MLVLHLILVDRGTRQTKIVFKKNDLYTFLFQNKSVVRSLSEHHTANCKFQQTNDTLFFETGSKNWLKIKDEIMHCFGKYQTRVPGFWPIFSSV